MGFDSFNSYFSLVEFAAVTTLVSDRNNGNGHGGEGCRFLGIANNLIKVRKVNHQIGYLFRCTHNGLDRI